MARQVDPSAKRPRISVDVDPDLRRRIRLAAAKRDLTVSEYVLGAVDEWLRQDIGSEAEEAPVITAADPVLVKLWDNPKDAAYDRL